MQGGLEGIIYWLSRVMEVIAGVFLVFMMLLTTFDVILRAFGRPIIGTYEMVALSGGMVIGFSVPITSWVRGQIFVDFFYQKFPRKYRIFSTMSRGAWPSCSSSSRPGTS